MLKKILLISFYDRVCLSNRALAASLKAEGHEVHLIFLKDDRTSIIDRFSKTNLQYQLFSLNKFIGCGIDINPISEKEINLLIEHLAFIQPDIVGISSRSSHKKLALQIARIVKNNNPGALTIAGGYGPTIEPGYFLKIFDYVLYGEGDRTLPLFVESKTKKKSYNIACLESGRLKTNPIFQPLDLDKLPFADWDTENKCMIEDNEIKQNTDFYDPQTYDIFASRGCISSCTYCGACQWTGMMKEYHEVFPKIRFRSPENVIKELSIAKKQFDIKYIRFKDSIFGVEKKWLFEFLDIYDKKIGLRFHCLLDERYTDKEKLLRLKKSGLISTTVGIQSSDREIRKNILKRNISNKDLINYANMLKANDIKIKYDILGWNPYESEKTLKNGCKVLKQLPKSNQITVFQLKMFPGTPLRDQYSVKPVQHLSFEQYTFWAIIYSMILYSDECEQKADEILTKKKFSWQETLEVFDRTIDQSDIKNILVANTDIKKGSIITNVMLGYKTMKEKEFIPYHKRLSIIGNAVAAETIPKGRPLTWKHIMSTYDKSDY